MRVNLDWSPYFEIADTDAPYREKMAAYGAIARERLDAQRFDDFCAEHLSDLDEITYEYFGTDRARAHRGTQGGDLVPCRRGCVLHRALLGPHPVLAQDRVRPALSVAVSVEQVWYSDRVEQQVRLVRWGETGVPVLLFPTAGGDAYEADRMGLIGSLHPLLEAGRIKVYSVDSIPGRSWMEGHDPRHSMWLQNQFDATIYHEVVPAIRKDCRDDRYRGGDRRSFDRGLQRGGVAVPPSRCIPSRDRHERHL